MYLARGAWRTTDLCFINFGCITASKKNIPTFTDFHTKTTDTKTYSLAAYRFSTPTTPTDRQTTIYLSTAQQLDMITLPIAHITSMNDELSPLIYAPILCQSIKHMPSKSRHCRNDTKSIESEWHKSFILEYVNKHIAAKRRLLPASRLRFISNFMFRTFTFLIVRFE